MSGYQLQTYATGKFHDAAIPATESKDAEQTEMGIPSSCVAGSSLDEIMNNPIDSGIDEG